MSKMLPVFRAGKYVAVREMVPDGRITVEHLQQIADNTNRMISETRFRPPVKLGHGLGRKAIGWIDGVVEVRGRHLYAPIDLNDEGKRLAKAKQVRFVSAEIDTGRTLFGDDDSERLGLRLAAVAALEADAPAIKDLCDLSTDAEFAEFKEYETRDGEYATAYFAQVTFNDQPPEPGNGGHMADEKPDAGAQFAELKEQNSTLTAKLSEMSEQLKATNAKLMEAESARKEAEFKEQEATFATFSEAAAKEHRWNGEQAKKLNAFAAKLIRNDCPSVAEFEDVLKHMPKFGSHDPIPQPSDSGAANGITEATFAEAVTDPKAAARIMDAVNEKRKTNPKYTDRDLLAELTASN